MYGKVWTCNNYHDLNDKWVKIKEFKGNMVIIEIYDVALGKPKDADLRLSEIKEIREDVPSEMEIFIQR